MPEKLDVTGIQWGCGNSLEYQGKHVQPDQRLAVSVRQVAVLAIDIAEGGGLDDGEANLVVRVPFQSLPRSAHDRRRACGPPL